LSRRTYPKYPIPAVAALIIDAKNVLRVLLVKRGNPPRKGFWSLPGGVIKVGERITDGLKREVFEETGIRIRVGPLIYICEYIETDSEGVKYHYVILDYLASPITREIKPGGDVADAKWFTPRELRGLKLTPGTLSLLANQGLIDTYV